MATANATQPKSRAYCLWKKYQHKLGDLVGRHEKVQVEEHFRSTATLPWKR